MKTHLLPAIKLTFITLIIFGVVYPLLITGIAKLAGANGGKGKILSERGKVYGFEVIGQSFVSEKYFTSRPSAVGYNAAATGGSNKGPSNPDYMSQVEERIVEFLKHNPTVKREDVPVDLVTASGGGLDPHISPAAALVQVSRIANSRSISENEITALVSRHVEIPLFNLFGPPKVNVLKLNIALDQLK